MRKVSRDHLLILSVLGTTIASGVGIVLLSTSASGTVVALFAVGTFAIGWATLGVIAVTVTRTRSELKSLRAEFEIHEGRQLERTRRLEAAIEAERAKESRHEYAQERTLDRIESRLREATAGPGFRRTPPRSKQSPDVLFVTSNGAGLGHLTRLLAVADRMSPGHSVEFLTLSRAYTRVVSLGYRIRYFPSADVAGIGPRLWNATFRSFLQDLFAETLPKLVVFDGTVVYDGLVDVCRGHDLPIVWMQRGCWKREADERYPARRNAATVADHVIIPGDYACEEFIDVGNGLGVTRVGPIVLTREREMLSASSARYELRLSDSRRHILFSLGGGSLSDPESHLSILRELATTSLERFQITVVLSPLAVAHDFPPEINVIHKYPVARWMRAFDLVISAAGYNSVQEAAGLKIPMILVPNRETQTDDQVRRAESAAEQGWACVAYSPVEVRDRVQELFSDPTALTKMQARLSAVPEPNGAEEAAATLETLLGRTICQFVT